MLRGRGGGPPPGDPNLSLTLSVEPHVVPKGGSSKVAKVGNLTRGAHTCRAVPRPTYTTPQHLRIQGKGKSSSLHSLELGDEHTTECLGGRPREGVAGAAMDFLTKYESPPRSIEIHTKWFSPTCPYF